MIGPHVWSNHPLSHRPRAARPACRDLARLHGLYRVLPHARPREGGDDRGADDGRDDEARERVHERRRRRYGAYKVDNVLTGFWLYWHLTGGFQPALSRTMAARLFGTGGLAGLIAIIIGGAVVGRSWKKMEDPSQSDAARRRVTTWALVMLVLQIIALVLMAIGHYV